MFGIAWGIISITLMVAAGEGLRVGQQKAAEGLGKDLMICFAGRTSQQAGGVRAQSVHSALGGLRHRWRSSSSRVFCTPR